MKIKCKVNFHGQANEAKLKELLLTVIPYTRDLIKAASLPNTSATVSVSTKKGATALAKNLRAIGLTATIKEDKS